MVPIFFVAHSASLLSHFSFHLYFPMCLRLTRLFRSAITERYYTGTITALTHDKGKILCDSSKTPVNPFHLKEPTIKSPAAVHAEGLRDMFMEYYPCGEKAEAPLTVDFTEDSLARGQVMRALRPGYRVRFDVIQITGDRDVAEDALVQDGAEYVDEGAQSTKSATVPKMQVETSENLLHRRKGDAKVVSLKSRKQYAVSNLMVISSIEGITSHKAFAKARDEMSLV